MFLQAVFVLGEDGGLQAHNEALVAHIDADDFGLDIAQVVQGMLLFVGEITHRLIRRIKARFCICFP